MLMLIIGMSLLYSYVMSYPAHQPVHRRSGSSTCSCRRWVLLAAILFMVIVLGFFLPPVSIILDDRADHPAAAEGRAGFDLIWFGVVMTIVMEMGLDPSAGRIEHLRHQEHRAGYSARRRDLGRDAASWS